MPKIVKGVPLVHRDNMYKTLVFTLFPPKSCESESSLEVLAIIIFLFYVIVSFFVSEVNIIKAHVKWENHVAG